MFERELLRKKYEGNALAAMLAIHITIEDLGKNASAQDVALASGIHNVKLVKQTMEIMRSMVKSETSLAIKDNTIFNALEQSFLAKSGPIYKYGKERAKLKIIVEKINAFDNPETAANAFVTQFYNLVTSDDKFWSKRAFLPSAVSEAMFDQIMSIAMNTARSSKIINFSGEVMKHL